MLRNLLVLSSFILISIINTSCTSMEYPKVYTEQLADDFQTLSYTADIRGTHVIKKNGQYWILAEPAPDAAFAYDQDEAASIDLSLVSYGKNNKESESVQSGSEDLPLTGRSSYLLLARELSYRLNEMAFNTNATYDQYMEAYKLTLNTIENIAKIEAANITQSSKIEITTGASSSLAVTDSRESKNDRTETDQNNKSETETEQSKPAANSPESTDSTDN